MKPIAVPERAVPFSHAPGCAVLIPGTPLVVRIFPARLHFVLLEGIEERELLEVPLPIGGPVKGFTVQLDLERGEVYVSGEARTGYFRYALSATLQGVELRVHKGDIPPLKIPQVSKCERVNEERLSFGCHKQQEWGAMRRRCDPREFLPLWLRLAAWSPPEEGSGPFLELLARGEIETLFQAAFRDLFLPRAWDDAWQGIAEGPTPPLALLQQGAAWIRARIVRMEEELVLAPYLVSGRMVNLSFPWGSCDLEWTKGAMRRIALRGEGCLRLRVKGATRCRVVSGKECYRHEFANLLEIKPGSSYLLDRIE